MPGGFFNFGTLKGRIMGKIVIFWAVLPDGRTNSVSSTNIIEAKRRASGLGAKKLFCFDVEKGDSQQIF